MLRMPFSTEETRASPAGQTRPEVPNGWVERRFEKRYSCDTIPALVRIDGDADSTSGRVLDISISGVRLGLDSWLEAGRSATIWFGNVVATGEVRYCRSNTDGSFDMGFLLSDVLNRI